jgi:hypothetical protein
MYPSFTAVVLELSCGGSVECGTARDALPDPREVASATLFRAELALIFNLSMVFSVPSIEMAE